MRQKSLLVGVAATLFGGMVAAQEPNLLVNGGFDDDLSGWTRSSYEAVDVDWSEQDADASPTSGSAVTHQSWEEAYYARHGLNQCVSVVPGATYRLSGKILVPAGQDRTGWARIGLDWRRGSCEGGYLDAPVTDQVDTVGVWTAVDHVVVAPAEAGGAFVLLSVFKDEAGGTLDVNFDSLALRRVSGTGCEPDAETLCLRGGRFRVTARFDTGTGRSGPAQTQSLTSDTGYLWFFDEANVEAVVKVLDGCSVNGRFWVFAAGLTDVEVELRVEDTRTGREWTASNPQGVAFEPIQDTSAFDTCQ